MTAIQIETFPASALVGGKVMHDGMPTRGVTIAGNDPAVLMGIHRPGVNLAIWHRAVPATLRGGAVRKLLQSAPFTAVAVGSPEELPDRLSQQLPAPAPFELLLDLADMAAALSLLDGGSTKVRIRLEALVHDGCRRWHADAVGLRMLCTYMGAGTQWLALDGGAPAARALTGDLPPRSIGQLPAGAVAVLKGEGYPDNAGNGCIHRSPTAGVGPSARLLACVDQTEWNLDE